MQKILVFIFVFISFLLLASCNKNHEHTYDDYLVYESGHYRPYTCGCPQIESLESHLDGDSNNLCDLCGYKMTIDDVFEFEYVAADDGHCMHKVGESCDGSCIKSPHEDMDNDLKCDICVYTLLDTTQVAKIVTNYEQNEKDKILELKNTNPEMIYYFNPVDQVSCTFLFYDSNSVNRIILEYDIYNVFEGADIDNYDSIKMLTIQFERDNFTEAIYQKINQIKENETSVKELYISMERWYIESYMPDIDYYVDEKTVLNYEVLKELFNLTEEKGFIIKSKEEYEVYLDYLLEIEDFEPIRENINLKRELYDETFFEENALIISSLITRGSGSINLTLDNLYISNDKVYIVVRTDEPEMGTADILTTTFSFIVKKSDVLNVNEVITLE